MFPCDDCTQVFTRKSNLVRHRAEEHRNIPQVHYVQHHGPHINCTAALPEVTRNHITRYISVTSFGTLVRNIIFIPVDPTLPTEFFTQASSLINDTLEILLNEGHPLKILCSINVRFEKQDRNDESYFSSKTLPVCILDMDQVIASLLAQIENYIKRGSAWKLTQANYFSMNVVRYNCI